MIIERLLQHRWLEAQKHVRQPSVVWVTDLTTCSLKRKLAEENPIIDASTIYNLATVIGDLVHVGLETLMKEWFKIETEVEYTKQFKGVYIRGRVDAVLRDYDLGVEIKTARSDLNLPHEHHITQSSIYLWLADLKKIYLTYITPDRMTEYEVSTPIKEDELAKLLSENKAPRYNWECKYCQYDIICPNKLTARS